MKIAFVTHNYPLFPEERSNAGVFVYDISESLAKKGHQVSVFVVNSDVTKKRVLLGGKLKLYFIGEGSLRKSLGAVKPYNLLDVIKIVGLFSKSRQEITEILRKEPVDFILSFWAIPSGILAYQISKALQIPYGIWALGSDVYVYQKFPIVGNLISQAVKNANLLLADGIDLANVIEKLNHKKCEFLPSATRFESRATKVPVDQKKVNFVFLGRMEKVKGPDVLLASLEKLSTKLNYHTYFIGGGSLLNDLSKRSIDAGLEEHVSFLGNLDDRNLIFSYFCVCDFLVIPSRRDSIPLVLSEGAKSGIPVIVSDAGDLSTLIDKYEIGYVFRSENIEELFSILKKTVQNGKKDKSKFKTNLEKFAKEFDIDQVSIKLIASIKKSL